MGICGTNYDSEAYFILGNDTEGELGTYLNKNVIVITAYPKSFQRGRCSTTFLMRFASSLRTGLPCRSNASSGPVRHSVLFLHVLFTLKVLRGPSRPSTSCSPCTVEMKVEDKISVVTIRPTTKRHFLLTRHWANGPSVFGYQAWESRFPADDWCEMTTALERKNCCRALGD